MINITDRIFEDPEITFNFKDSDGGVSREINELTDTYLSSKRKIEQRIARIRSNNNALSETTPAPSAADCYQHLLADNYDQLQSILNRRAGMVRSLRRIKELQASLDDSSTPPVLVDRAQIAAEFMKYVVTIKGDPQFISYRKSSTEYDQYAVVNLDHGWRANIWMDGRATIHSGSSEGSEKLLSTALTRTDAVAITSANSVQLINSSTYQDACNIIAYLVVESRSLQTVSPF